MISSPYADIVQVSDCIGATQRPLSLHPLMAVTGECCSTQQMHRSSQLYLERTCISPIAGTDKYEARTVQMLVSRLCFDKNKSYKIKHFLKLNENKKIRQQVSMIKNVSWGLFH